MEKYADENKNCKEIDYLQKKLKSDLLMAETQQVEIFGDESIYDIKLKLPISYYEETKD